MLGAKYDRFLPVTLLAKSFYPRFIDWKLSLREVKEKQTKRKTQEGKVEVRGGAKKRKSTNPSMKGHSHSPLIPLALFPLGILDLTEGRGRHAIKIPLSSFKSHIQVTCRTEQHLNPT